MNSITMGACLNKSNQAASVSINPISLHAYLIRSARIDYSLPYEIHSLFWAGFCSVSNIYCRFCTRNPSPVSCWLLIGCRRSPTLFQTFSNIFTTPTLSTAKIWLLIDCYLQQPIRSQHFRVDMGILFNRIAFTGFRIEVVAGEYFYCDIKKSCKTQFFSYNDK